LLTAVLQDLGGSDKLKLCFVLGKILINQKIGKAFPKPRKATKRYRILYQNCTLKKNSTEKWNM